MTKKILLSLTALVTLTLIVFSCSRNNELISENPAKESTVNKFLNSESYKRVSRDINSYGTISAQDVTIDSIVVKDKGTFHYFTIAIKKNGVINATLDVVDLHDTEDLPYNDKYAMNLNDMSEFNTKTLSGKIKLYDLNYDKFNHTEINLLNNKIENVNYKRPSEKFLNKFASLRMKENNVQKNFAKVTYGAARVPCDKNGNGNLSFFECYGCFKSAIEIEDTFGNWWCDVPVAGWASCWASTSASCAILSSIY